MTVATYRGAVESTALGPTLMHEHVFVMSPELALNHPDFADWDEDAAVDAAVARLEELADRGIGTIVDMTVLGLGRMPVLVEQVARRTRVNIVAATGVYVLAELPLYLKLRGPGAMFDEVDPLVQLFVRDLTEGMHGTDVRAAVIKGTSDKAGLTPDVERALRAAARAQRETGALLATHSNAKLRGGLEQLALLRGEGVDLGRVLVGHSGDSDDLDYLCALLDAGAHLGMDRFGLPYFLSFERRVATVARLCELGYASRMVLSHDAACHNDAFRPSAMHAWAPDHHHCHISDDVLPALTEAGVASDDLHAMLVDVPQRLLAPEGAAP